MKKNLLRRKGFTRTLTLAKRSFANFIFSRFAKPASTAKNSLAFKPFRKTSPKLVFGFTLIELLVVIAIISLIASIVLASLTQARAQARDAQRVSDMRALQNALELYYLDHGEYPSAATFSDCNGSGDFSSALSSALVDEGYISQIPNDPLFPNNGFTTCYYYTKSTNYECGGVENTGFILAFNLENNGFNLPKAGQSGFGQSIGEYCFMSPR